MPSTPAANPEDPLGRDTINTMLHAVLDALPHRPQASAAEIASQRKAAMHAIVALRPREAIAAMLSARLRSGCRQSGQDHGSPGRL
jgi:hypothetical protein